MICDNRVSEDWDWKITIIQNTSITILLSFHRYTHFCPTPTLSLSSDNHYQLSITIILAFQELHINGIIQYVPSGFSLFTASFSGDSSMLLYIATVHSFYYWWVLSEYSMVCSYHLLFNHSQVKGHLSCFWSDTITN